MDIDYVDEISSLELLPDEILFDILLRLDIPELHSLSMVSPPKKILARMILTAFHFYRHVIVFVVSLQIHISMKSDSINIVPNVSTLFSPSARQFTI